MSYQDSTWDIRSNITLCLQEFPRASPSGTPSGKMLYLNVYPSSRPNTDTLTCSACRRTRELAGAASRSRCGEGREGREGRERRKGEEGGDHMIFYTSSLCLHTFLIFLLAITYIVNNCLIKERVGMKVTAQYISEKTQI